MATAPRFPRLLFSAVVVLTAVCHAHSAVNPAAAAMADEWQMNSSNAAAELYRGDASRLAGEALYADAADSYCRAADLYLRVGKNETALEMLRAAFDLPNAGNESRLATSARLSSYYFGLGDPDRASPFFQEAMRLYPLVESAAVRADAALFLIDAAVANGDNASILAFAEQSVEAYRQTSDRIGLSRALTALCYANLANDRTTEGRERALEAVRVALETGDRRASTLSKTAAGLADFRLGRYAEALEYLNDATSGFPDGVDAIERALLLNNAGRVYDASGECEGAISNISNAAVIFERENNAMFGLGNLMLLGSVKRRCGQLREAEVDLSTALVRARNARSRHDEVRINYELGMLYFDLRDFDKADSFLRASITMDTGNEFQLDRVDALTGLGRSAVERSKFTDAETHFNEALRRAEVIRDDQSIAGLLDLLADVRTRQNKPLEALTLAEKSVAMTEELFEKLDGDQLRTSFRSRFDQRYLRLIGLLMHTGNPADQSKALNVAEQARSRVMIENLRFLNSPILKDADPVLLDRERACRQRIHVKSDEITDLLNRQPDQGKLAQLTAELGDAERELDQIRVEVRKKSPQFAALKDPPHFDSESFRKDVLGDDSQLLELVLGDEVGYLWLVDSNRISTAILPGRRELEASAAEISRLMEQRAILPGETIEDFQNRQATAARRFEDAVTAFAKVTLGPISAEIGSKRLIIAADGKLHNFPFASLPNPTTGKPLIETNEIVYTPSAQILALLVGKSRGQRPSKSLLVFSDPVFSTDDPRLSDVKVLADNGVARDRFRFVESLDQLTRLDGTLEESKVVSASVGGDSVSYSGFDANRQKLLNAGASEYQILHFATHGLVDESRPELSGIVFSRFDADGNPVDEVFRLNDIYGLDLNADLVVLSACRTAVGKEMRGEGLASLNNAFLQTGARSVLSTLWQVEDGATLELMKHFYAAMIDEKLPPPAALRKAQLALRENPRYRSPFYWAAFTVQGDFRNVPVVERRDRRSVYIGGAAAVVAILISWFFIRRRRRMSARP